MLKRLNKNMTGYTKSTKPVSAKNTTREWHLVDMNHVRINGYVRLIRLYARDSDNAMMARLEWTDTVVKKEMPKEVEPVKEKAEVTKPAPKKATAKKTK